MRISLPLAQRAARPGHSGLDLHEASAFRARPRRLEQVFTFSADRCSFNPHNQPPSRLERSSASWGPRHRRSGLAPNFFPPVPPLALRGIPRNPIQSCVPRRRSSFKGNGPELVTRGRSSASLRARGPVALPAAPRANELRRAFLILLRRSHEGRSWCNRWNSMGHGNTCQAGIDKCRNVLLPCSQHGADGRRGGWQNRRCVKRSR